MMQVYAGLCGSRLLQLKTAYRGVSYRELSFLLSSCVGRSSILASPLHSLTNNCKATPIADYVETKNAELRDIVCKNMRLVPEFITKEEESSLMKEIDPYLRKLRYEVDHWDAAIHNFRETERLNWRAENQRLIDRIRSTAIRSDAESLQHAHILDLHENGFIKPHVDAVRYCGDTIATVSLLSDSVMVLTYQDESQKQKETDLRKTANSRSRDLAASNAVQNENPALYVKVHVPRRSLYIMYDAVRYKFAHEIVANNSSLSSIRGSQIRKTRRVAIILRSVPPQVSGDDADPANSTYGVL